MQPIRSPYAGGTPRAAVAGVDLVWAVAGFVVGAAAIGALFEARLRSRPRTPAVKLTTGWRLTELHEPWIVARDLPAQPLPSGARVLASGLVDPQHLQAGAVRAVPPVRAEFALDARNRRALLFLGGLEPGSLACVTVDPDIVARLEQEARTLWDRAGAYVERLPIAALAGKQGITVETQGMVQAVLPYLSLIHI